jgi:hypothetical protein
VEPPRRRDILAKILCRAMMTTMSETAVTSEQRDRGGRFVIGGKPGPGRPPGARSKLGEEFLEHLRTSWSEHGAAALQRCAVEDPAAFCRIVAGLLPRDVSLTADIELNAAGLGQCESADDLARAMLDTMPLSEALQFCDEVRGSLLMVASERAEVIPAQPDR